VGTAVKSFRSPTAIPSLAHISHISHRWYELVVPIVLRRHLVRVRVRVRVRARVRE